MSATKEHSEMLKDIAFVMESKKLMLKRGSRRAVRTCPNCGAKVHFTLAGPKDHIRATCETPNCMRMME